ncbi:MAG: hypothetical protein IT377_25015 [Polyangiaceae bacterium]|nr:hypothetical protein [Polyangiaceae bacterium]
MRKVGARKAPWGAAEQRESTEVDAGSDPALELMDVPAAVVCAWCGDPSCLGGCQLEETTQTSKIVAIVPWERPGSAPGRLWGTAKLSTLGAEQFFGALPDGDLGPPLRFALLSEALAVAGMAVVAVPLVLAFAPWLLESISRDPWLRAWLVRLLAFGMPGLAVLMVLLHALHGLGLDFGARRAGARSRTRRSLRFGLYSCGWDLVTLPAGLGMLAITDGFTAARRAVPMSLTVPRLATRAFLRGAYQLDDEGSAQASRRAMWLASALALLACGLFGATMVALALL